MFLADKCGHVRLTQPCCFDHAARRATRGGAAAPEGIETFLERYNEEVLGGLGVSAMSVVSAPYAGGPRSRLRRAVCNRNRFEIGCAYFKQLASFGRLCNEGVDKKNSFVKPLPKLSFGQVGWDEGEGMVFSSMSGRRQKKRVRRGNRTMQLRSSLPAPQHLHSTFAWYRRILLTLRLWDQNVLDERSPRVWSKKSAGGRTSNQN